MRHLRVWVLALALVIAPWAAALTAPTVTLAEPTIIGYADGSTLGVGVGPIYRVPDTFGGPDPYFIRYPAPSLNPSASTEPVGNSNTIHDPGPAKYSEPFAPSGPRPLFSNGGLCTSNAHHAFSAAAIDTGSTAYKEGAVYVVSMPDKADTNNWRSCSGLAGFNLFAVSLQNSNWTGAIAQIEAARGWVCGNYYDNPVFLYTPDVLGNGYPCPQWTLVPFNYNHNYYFRVDNFNAGAYNYWEYCGNDLTNGTGTRCLAQINSTSMKSGAGYMAYWAGSETADMNDTMGGYANADYLLYAFHVTTTAGLAVIPT